MARTLYISGLDVTLPDEPIEKPTIGKNKFQKVVIPDSFKRLEYDADENPIYTVEQWDFINREIDRCNDGYWFYNNNELTYINGFYYFYLNYWVLENGVKPDYRDCDRLFFYFFEYCYNHPKIIGILRGKKRREGASSMGSSISTKIATFSPNRNCGLVSMNDTYAEKLFSGMIVNGFYKLPEFLRPRIDTSSTNKKKLHFIETPKRGKSRNSGIEGLNSIMDFMTTTLNAYDSTRLSFLLGDEWGKWEKIDINRYYAVVKECVKIGAKKVGFIYAPTTVNPPKQGGDNFKILWDSSNQYIYGLDTPTGMVQFFQPAYEGLEGFIDEFGHSVIDEPNEKTLQFLIKKTLELDEKERIPVEELSKGAKKYLADEFAKLKTEEQKSDFRRKFPNSIDDMWDFGSSFSPFNLDKIKARKNFLINNPIPLRRGELELNTEKILLTNGDHEMRFAVDFKDNENGNWLFYGLPEQRNKFEIDWDKKIVIPLNTTEYAGGCDTFRSDKTSSLGSMGTIVIASKFDDTRADGGGIIQAIYIGRPKLAEFFWEQIMLASLYFGCIISVENDATSEYRLYFSNRLKNLLNLNALPLLGRKPDAAIDPNRANAAKNLTVINSSDPFIFAKQIELAQIYFERHCNKIYFIQILEDAQSFNPDDRTKFDLLIGFMMCLLNLTGQTKVRKQDYKNEKLIATYNLKPALRY